MASIGSCRSAGHIDGRSERADDVAFEEGGRPPTPLSGPPGTARSGAFACRSTRAARASPHRTRGGRGSTSTCQATAKTDRQLSVRSRTRCPWRRRRCGRLSPGADVGQPVPAQMWASQSRRRCGLASPGADVVGPCRVVDLGADVHTAGRRRARRTSAGGSTLLWRRGGGASARADRRAEGCGSPRRTQRRSARQVCSVGSTTVPKPTIRYFVKLQ